MADITAANWNESDSANSTASPDGWPEGMAPSGVNDTGRAMAGALKRWYDWSIPATTGGSSTAYTISYAVAPGALVDGMVHMIQWNVANGNAPTLNINSLGAIPIQYYSVGAWRPVPAGLWAANWIAPVTYNASAGAYRLIGFDNRTGTVEAFSGTAAPAGTIFAFGQAISRTTFVGLFTATGTAHGVGNGTTTFNVIDMRGRVPPGKDDMGGTPAGRLTSAGSGVAGITLGASGGAQLSQFMDAPNLDQLVEGNAVDTPVEVAHQSHLHANVRVVQPSVVVNYVVRI